MATELAEKPVAEAEVSALEVVRHVPAVRIYGHSSILYWWPVWLSGLIMAAITYLDGSRAAIVPNGSAYDAARKAIVLPAEAENSRTAGSSLGARSAQSKYPGLVFTAILLAVIFITNTPLRGLWSMIAVLVIALASVTFAWLGAWPDILAVLDQLTIHINLGFYLFFSSVLFLLWAAVVFVFDRTRYWTFRPGQLTHDSVFGSGQKSYDTSGMLFEKVRNDPFRHWILGLGSGDLLIKTFGAQQEKIQISNVLFMNGILGRVQELVAESPD